MKHLIILLLGILVPIMTQAQETQFSSDLLRHSVEVLCCKEQIDSMPNGSWVLTLANGVKVRAEKRYDRLVHLGKPVFDDQFLTSVHPIFHYVEFAALDKECHISDNPFLYKCLRFTNGDWTLLSLVTPETPCRVEALDGALYRVEWQMPDSTLLTIEGPVEHDRMALMSRREIENLFMAEVTSFRDTLSRMPTDVDASELSTSDSILWKLPGDSYTLKTVNQDTYYIRQDSMFSLVCDSIYMAESMTNIINAYRQLDEEALMSVSFDNYGFKHDTCQFRLKDFLSYCQSMGCVPFWGLEKRIGTKISGSLYLVNRTSSYVHLLRLIADLGSLPQSVSFVGRGSLFIPTGHIGNLFQKYQPNSKKKKIRL